MQSDVIVNVRDITSKDIVVPDTSADTPNTGYQSIVDGRGVDVNASSNNIILLGIVSAIIVVAIILLSLIAKGHHIRLILRNNKHIVRSLMILAVIVSILSFVILKEINNSYNLAKAEGNTTTLNDSLVISTTDSILNLDLGDDSTFGYSKNTITVTSPTVAGYTLAAYIDGDTRDLANVTNAEAADVRIAGLESSELQALTDNTWGFALQEPESKDAEVFSGLPTDENAPLILKTKCTTTESDDETDVYIGAYVVPGLPAGTYSGVTVNYVAVANIVSDDITVDFHGNGLFFDEEQTQNENTVVYGYSSSAIDTSEQGVCGIITKSGTYMNTFNSDNSTWYSLINNPDASNPNDTLGFSGEDGVKDYLKEKHDEYEGQTMDLYATKNYTIHYDANTGEGEMADQILSAAGRLSANTFMKVDLVFSSWNTEADGSGTSYSNKQRVDQIAKPGQTITLYAQWADCVNNSVCYKRNGDDVVGYMDAQASPLNGVIQASSFKRDGYSYAGWNTKPDYTGTFYGPNQTINGSEIANGLILYAVWLSPAGTIQNWDGCASLAQAPTDGTATLSNVVSLTDERDGNVYTVAKLPDGHCWTTENLRLDNTVELTATSTHNPSLPITNVYDLSLTSNHLTSSSSVAYNVDTAPEGWCFVNSDACVNQSRFRIDNTFGGYYNWYSATAGNGKRYRNNDTDGDICPVGWRLPTGGSSSGEYFDLANVFNGGVNDRNTSNKARSFPFNFLLSGHVNRDGAIEFAGFNGRYWSSTPMKYTAGAYGLNVTLDRLDYGISGNSISSYVGSAVRCVAND